MSSIASEVGHPHVTIRKGICGGKPLITGTRIPVWAIAGWFEKGYSVEDIQQEIYPSLGVVQIADALSYYHEHQEEIALQLQGKYDFSRGSKKASNPMAAITLFLICSALLIHRARKPSRTS